MRERKLINNKIELLIPVGGISQLIAAVENGADAVYLGGTAFNARMGAENFHIEKMEEAVDFCHLRGVRVFVTMNTLMKDEQLKKALEYARKLYIIGVDALIIQDLGLGDLIRENTPDMELHLSTQGTIFGEGGVKMAHSLGFSRVVLAREMPLDLIEKSSRCSQVETEVFVHGALCFCFSGQCQLSRTIGGRSGNQGMCAQPCRLPYSLDGEAPRYHLSPKDLCLVDYLGDLIKAGVSSLKVEGRLKSPEYVAIVTGIYRKYIDEFYHNGSFQVTEEDRSKLLQIFNRGNFTQDYIKGASGEELMSRDFPKNQGIYIGRVQTISKVRDRYIAEINCSMSDSTKQLSLGDIVEARHYDGRGNLITESATVTYLKKKGSSINGNISIGDFKKPLPKNGNVYRVVSKELNMEGEDTYKGKTLESGKYIRTTPIDMTLKSRDDIVTLEVSSPLIDKAIIENIKVQGDLEPRENLTKIRENLQKLGGTPFHGDNTKVVKPIPVALKISQLNSIRRNAVKELEKEIILKHKKSETDIRDKMEVQVQCETSMTKDEIGIRGVYTKATKEDVIERPCPEVYYYSLHDFEEERKTPQMFLERENTVALLPLADILLSETHLSYIDQTVGARGYRDWIPYISNVSMGKEDEIIRQNLVSAKGIAKNKGIYLGNLQWYEMFKEIQCKMYGDFGLNAYNSATVVLLKKMGFDKVEASSETYGEENGAYPLMTMQHKIDGDRLKDRRGMEISVVKRDWSDQAVLVKKGIKWDKVTIDKRVFFAK